MDGIASTDHTWRWRGTAARAREQPAMDGMKTMTGAEAPVPPHQTRIGIRRNPRLRR
jgi:hypothetical protein